jgi:hypothetical protein
MEILAAILQHVAGAGAFRYGYIAKVTIGRVSGAGAIFHMVSRAMHAALDQRRQKPV